MTHKVIVLLLLFIFCTLYNGLQAKEIPLDNPNSLIHESTSLSSAGIQSEISLQDQLNHLIEMEKESRDFRESLTQDIEDLKRDFEDQQNKLEQVSVSVDTLQENVDKNKTKIIANKKLDIIGFANTSFRIYSNAPRYGNYLNAPWKDNGSTFSARHILIAPKYYVNDHAYWSTKIAWIDGGNTVTVAGSQLDYKVFDNDSLILRAGLLSPLEMNPTSLAPYAYQRNLVDYSLLDTYLVPHFLQDVGIGLKGTLPIRDTSMKLRYEIDILNGFKDTMVPINYQDGYYITDFQEFSGLIGAHPKAGKLNLRDNNANKALMGRVVLIPFQDFELGTSYHRGAIDSEGVNNLRILGFDAKIKYKKIYALFEYIQTLVEKDPALSSQGVPFQKFPAKMNGWYGELNYFLNPQIALVGGYGSVDLHEGRPGFTLTRHALGVNYMLDSNLHLKCEYQVTTGRDSLHEPTSNAFLSELVLHF